MTNNIQLSNDVKKIIVVEDDYSIRSFLKEALEDMQYSVCVAENGERALKIILENPVDLIISDLKMPVMTGMELLNKVMEFENPPGFILISAFGTIEEAVKSVQIGAYDFVTKPFTITDIENRLNRFFDFQHLKKENKELKKEILNQKKFNKIIGQSKAISQIFDKINLVLPSDATVLISGESGTGKELVAQLIVEGSKRKECKYIQVNCAAIPENLMESTMFGYMKGAFTGALKTTEGMFHEADGGTLLLDEISEIPVTMQAKLLRVLQENQIIRVGNNKHENIDVRIIATSNRNLPELIKDGNFREDLYYRLNIFPIEVPPLRDRLEDMPPLAGHFLQNFKDKYNYPNISISKNAMLKLEEYDWPGNIRQLQNSIERGVLLTGGTSDLKAEHILLTGNTHTSSDSALFNGNITIGNLEREAIFATLRRTKNNRTRAAKVLDITVRTLRNKLNLYKEQNILPKEFLIE